jgi:hypothetical protein
LFVCVVCGVCVVCVVCAVCNVASAIYNLQPATCYVLYCYLLCAVFYVLCAVTAICHNYCLHCRPNIHNVPSPFTQVNDDTIIVTPNWATKLVHTLASNPSIPNFGVTGPSDTNNGKIFTHSFVHRTHMEVFGHLFPPYFKNWWSDDWITTVCAVVVVCALCAVCAVCYVLYVLYVLCAVPAVPAVCRNCLHFTSTST